MNKASLVVLNKFCTSSYNTSPPPALVVPLTHTRRAAVAGALLGVMDAGSAFTDARLAGAVALRLGLRAEGVLHTLP